MVCQPTTEPAPIYTAMRNQILTLVPAEVGIVPTSRFPRVWGVLTEMGLQNGVATLVSLADGTTSLYFSGGGGIIGCGEHAAVAAATRALVAEAGQYFDAMAPATDLLPAAGRVRFYLLAFAGARTAEAGQDELAAGRHALAPLFRCSNDVITQVRLHSAPSESPPQPGAVPSREVARPDRPVGVNGAPFESPPQPGAVPSREVARPDRPAGANGAPSE